jgi:hypothetical protein
MPRGSKTDHGETINTRTVKKLKREAQVESWAHRFAAREARVGWHEHAACRGTDVAAWFDEDRTRRHDLLPFCSECPVRVDCGREAIDTEQRHPGLVHGVRAGFGAFDRHKAAVIFDRLTQSA